jgi:hypothetical protein
MMFLFWKLVLEYASRYKFEYRSEHETSCAIDFYRLKSLLLPWHFEVDGSVSITSRMQMKDLQVNT